MSRKLEELRFWLADHSGVVGMALCLAIGGGALGTAVLVLHPFAPAGVETGRITTFGVASQGKGIQRVAYVQLTDRVVSISAPVDSGCRVGQSVKLQKRVTILGPLYDLPLTGCAP